jgi:hypothetical protein
MRLSLTFLRRRRHHAQLLRVLCRLRLCARLLFTLFAAPCTLVVLVVFSPCSRETTTPVDEAVAAVAPASPVIFCSQLRLKETEEQIGFSPYPTPPAAPRKDQFILPSESDSYHDPPPLPRCSLGGYSCTTPRTRDGSRFPTLTLGFMKTGATTIMRHSSMRI